MIMKIKLSLLLVLLCALAMTANAQIENAQQMKYERHSMADDSVVIDGDVVYTVADPIAQFKGGNDKMFNFLQSNLNIKNANPKEKHGNGRVLVQFYIAKDGTVKNVHIVHGLSPEMDMEALRVIKMMPNWIPARRNGQKVCMKMTIPINFKW
jgi:periplasmic protein TonB